MLSWCCNDHQLVLAVRTASCNVLFIVVLIIAAALQGAKPVLSWSSSSKRLHNNYQFSKGRYSSITRVVATSLPSSTVLSTTSTVASTEDPSTVIPHNLRPNDNSMVSPALSSRTQKLFRGQTVLITGASSGLGRSLALQVASCGAQTLVLSARNQEALNQVAQECQQSFDVAKHQSSLSKSSVVTLLQQDNLQIHVIPCDLCKPDDVAKLASQAIEICNGRIDVLINNGGISSRSRFVDTKLTVDEQLMQVNFFSGAALAKAVVPGMIQRGFGKIIWVSSVQGLMGIPHRTSYAASKFAVQGYCEALRAEQTSQGVDVHIASPGYIRTNLSKSAVTGDGTLHGQIDATTAKGAPPEKVARQILNHVAAGKAEFVVAATMSAKVAIWMRFLCPSLLRSMLVKRYQKTENGKH